MSALTAVTISGALVIGMVLALLGSIKLELARQLKLGEGRISGLLAALNLALIPMMLLSGYLIDHWGPRAVLILGSMLTAGAIFSMSLAPTYRRAFGAVLLIGAGVAAVSVTTVVLMPLAFVPDHTTPKKDYLSTALNLGHVFIALGALVTPVLADLLLRWLQYRRTVSFLAFLCLVPAFLCILPAFGDAVTAKEGELTASARSIFDEGRIWHLLLACAVFFFYAPLEGAVSIWSTTYLTQLGHSEHRAALFLSAFWTAFMSSRLLVAWLRLPNGVDPWLIAIPALLTAVSLGNLAGTASRSGARNGLILLGFLLGPILPTLLGIVFREFEHERGLAYGILFAIGSAGSLMAAPLVGLRIRSTNAQTALRIPMLIALVLTVVAVAFALVVRTGK
jgi:fucose permease